MLVFTLKSEKEANHFKIGEYLYIIIYSDRNRRLKLGFHLPKTFKISRITQQEFILETGVYPDYPQSKANDEKT